MASFKGPKTPLLVDVKPEAQGVNAQFQICTGRAWGHTTTALAAEQASLSFCSKICCLWTEKFLLLQPSAQCFSLREFICLIWPFEIVFESSFQVTCLYRLRSKTNFEFFQNRKEFQIRLNSLTHTAALQIKPVWWVRKLPIACTVLSAVWCRLGLLMADGQDGILLYFHLCNLDDKWNPEWHTSGCYADHRGWPQARLARRPPAARLSAELRAWLTDDDSLTRRLGQALCSLEFLWLKNFLKIIRFLPKTTKKINFVENCHQLNF